MIENETITVRQLINLLEKMNPDARVIFQKAKKQSGWCNDGLVCLNGRVIEKPGYGVIIS